MKNGDRVLLKKNLEIDKRYGTATFIKEAEHLRGKIVTVDFYSNCYSAFSIKELDEKIGYCFSELMVEKEIFTLADLKAGYLVEYKYGGCGLVFSTNGDIAISVNKDDLSDTFINDVLHIDKRDIDKKDIFLKLNKYKDDLTARYYGYEEYDIIKIYGYPSKVEDVATNSISDRPLLWESYPQVELSLQEIADKFDIPLSKLVIKYKD